MLLEHVNQDDLFRVYSRRYYRWKYILVINISDILATGGSALDNLVKLLGEFGFPLAGNFVFPGWALLESDETTLKTICDKLEDIDVFGVIYHNGFPVHESA